MALFATVPTACTVLNHPNVICAVYTPFLLIDRPPLYTLQLAPGQYCKDYCMNLAECNVFSFSLEDPTQCNLYKEKKIDMKSEFDTSVDVVVGSKHCALVAGVANVSLSDLVERSQDTGLVMQSIDTMECLVRGQPLSGVKGFYLAWSEDCEDCLLYTSPSPRD